MKNTGRTDFNASTLMISARSPFARRVRLALREHGVSYEERVFDVFKPQPELIASNPLARVPALILKSGEVLIDSHLILHAFYESQPESPLRPSSPVERLASYHWSGLAIGFAEKIVEYYLETLRPEPHRDPELLQEFRDICGRFLDRVESHLAAVRQESLVAHGLTQADLDLGTALAYLKLRYAENSLEKYPLSAAYLARLDQRDSFAQTRPPR